MITLKSQVDGITKKLDGIIASGKTGFAQFFVRDAVPKYLKAQSERFMTENSSDYTAGGWKPLDPKYRERKLTQFSGYEGGGRKMLIAKGDLYKSVLAMSKDYRQVVGDKELIIGTTIPYAGFVDADRTISEFSPKFYTELSDDLAAYVRRNR